MMGMYFYPLRGRYGWLTLTSLKAACLVPLGSPGETGIWHALQSLHNQWYHCPRLPTCRLFMQGEPRRARRGAAVTDAVLWVPRSLGTGSAAPGSRSGEACGVSCLESLQATAPNVYPLVYKKLMSLWLRYLFVRTSSRMPAIIRHVHTAK